MADDIQKIRELVGRIAEKLSFDTQLNNRDDTAVDSPSPSVQPSPTTAVNQTDQVRSDKILSFDHDILEVVKGIYNSIRKKSEVFGESGIKSSDRSHPDPLRGSEQSRTERSSGFGQKDSFGFESLIIKLVNSIRTKEPSIFGASTGVPRKSETLNTNNPLAPAGDQAAPPRFWYSVLELLKNIVAGMKGSSATPTSPTTGGISTAKPNSPIIDLTGIPSLLAGFIGSVLKKLQFPSVGATTGKSPLGSIGDSGGQLALIGSALIPVISSALSRVGIGGGARLALPGKNMLALPGGTAGEGVSSPQSFWSLFMGAGKIGKNVLGEVAPHVSQAANSDSAEGSIAGVFGGISKVAAMIPGGQIFAGAMKFVEILVGSVDKVRKWVDNIHQSNMQFAEFSGSMAAVSAEQRAREIELKRGQGEMRSQSAQELADAKNDLDKTMAPIEDAVAILKNQIGTFLSQATRGGIELVKGLTGLKVVSDEIDKARQKMVDAGNKWGEFEPLIEKGRQRWSETYNKPRRFNP